MNELPLSPMLRRILLEACIITTLGLAVGVTFNYQMVLNAFTGKTVTIPQFIKSPPEKNKSSTTPVEQAFPDPIELDEVDELLAEGALLIDARNTTDYSKSHLQGAISLPLGELDARLDGFMAKVPKDRILIAYCNGFGCPDSFDVGVRLLEKGYQEVRVFEGGFPQWRDEGRPLEEGK